jgi:uncharacterized protein
MDITPFVPLNKNLITSYGGGGFSINKERIAGSIIITSEQVINWNVLNFEDFNQEKFDIIYNLCLPIELLLVGTGDKHHKLPKSYFSELLQSKIAIEAMQTGAACRTYNILIAEDRKVAAAMLYC